MKNFLTKKATMIGSIVAAAVVFVLLVAFCARPVAVGYSYKGEMDMGGVKVNYKIHFNSHSTVTQSYLDKDGKEIEGVEAAKYYYYERDGYVFVLGDAEGDGKMTKEELKEAKKEIKEMKDDVFEVYAKASGLKINAFKASMDSVDTEFKNAGAVATVVVLAVVDAALAGMAVASVLLSRKK